jgi:hypothetical protein
MTNTGKLVKRKVIGERSERFGGVERKDRIVNFFFKIAVP